MNGRILAFAAVFLFAPIPVHAASLDGAGMGWPWALPFAGILLSIATGPLLFPANLAPSLRQDRLRLGVLTLAALATFGVPAAAAAFVHAMLAEYLSFIVLLFALYVVAGGILVTGDLRGHARRQHRASSPSAPRSPASSARPAPP